MHDFVILNFLHSTEFTYGQQESMRDPLSNGMNMRVTPKTIT